MGLDMYLNAKRFLWHNENELAEKVLEAFPEVKGKRVKEVIVEAIYWRKANAIHDWFVKNVQEGDDNCGYYWVGREQLEELRQLILEALDKKDGTILPPCQGFFFGSDKIDEYYWEDLRRTEAELAKVLEEFPSGWDFEYHSSW
jgi:hypothetical protein